MPHPERRLEDDAGRPRHALILGLGRFGGGREAARFLHRRGARLRIVDGAPASSLSESVAALEDLDGVEWRLGEAAPAVELLDGIDLMVVNPAVPPRHPLLLEARRRGLPTTQEVDLFLDAYPGRVVLVTGTNGKSTTAVLLGNMLAAAGIDHLVGGNLGASLLAEEARWRRGQVAVLEISSFQLERLARRRRVTGAVLTRVTTDHLDRHGTPARYHAAKARAAGTARDFLVRAAEDAVAAKFASPARWRACYRMAPPLAGETGLEAGWLVSRLGAQPARLAHSEAMSMPGAFQRENALAAAAAALLLGASPHAVGLGLAVTRPLPHRLQLVAVCDRVRIYDNGVSTQLDSTVAALDALAGCGVRWVGGGKSKGADLDEIAAAVGPRVRSAHLFGAVARDLGARLALRAPTSIHERLHDALDAARCAARPGEALLFSPGFASFDQYRNFRQRAEDFLSWARALRPMT